MRQESAMPEEGDGSRRFCETPSGTALWQAPASSYAQSQRVSGQRFQTETPRLWRNTSKRSLCPLTYHLSRRRTAKAQALTTTQGSTKHRTCEVKLLFLPRFIIIHYKENWAAALGAEGSRAELAALSVRQDVRLWIHHLRLTTTTNCSGKMRPRPCYCWIWSWGRLRVWHLIRSVVM